MFGPAPPVASASVSYNELEKRSASVSVVVLSICFGNVFTIVQRHDRIISFLKKQNHFELIRNYNSCARHWDTVRPWCSVCIYISICMCICIQQLWGTEWKMTRRLFESVAAARDTTQSICLFLLQWRWRKKINKECRCQKEQKAACFGGTWPLTRHTEEVLFSVCTCRFSFRRI